MEYLDKRALQKIYGAETAAAAPAAVASKDDEAYNIGIYTSVGGVATAVGTAMGGPIGAALGAGIGATLSHLIVNHKDEVIKGLGQGTISLANNYSQGHKDGRFTSMPMAFQ